MYEKTIKDCEKILASLKKLKEKQNDIWCHNSDIQNTRADVKVWSLKDALNSAIEVYEDRLDSLKTLEEED